MNLFAILIKLVGALPARVLNAVQMDLNTFFMQVLDLIKHIDHAAVIRWEGNVK